MADPSSSDQSKAKRPKQVFTKSLRAQVQVDSLTVNSILDSFINFTRVQILAIESCVNHELHDEYLELQWRLLDAQQPHQARLRQTRRVSAEDVPKPSIARQLAQALHDISQDPRISSSVKDAVRYYEATCIGVSSFSQHKTVCTRDIKALSGNMDPVAYFEQLVEASERHLKSTTSTSTNPLPESSVEVSEVSTSGKNAAFSDEYLRKKVSSFIVKDKELEQAIPWDDMDDCGSGLKETLDIQMHSFGGSIEEIKSCPRGVLLHGDQGTGKTSFVESFAANYKLKFFKVGSQVHGSLRGQSEKLIRYIFEAIRESAKDKPCVLFFDEVDALLGGSTTAASGFEGAVKELWSDFMHAKVQCFIFGATNKPWLINMGDFSRRFSLKVHIVTPQSAARKVIVKKALQPFWHDIDDNGLEKIAAATGGYSTNDIGLGIIDKVAYLSYETSKATKWQQITIDDKKYWVPVDDSRPGAMTANAAALEPKKYRQLTTKMIVELFESGKVVKTSSSEAEEVHRKWNAENSGRK